MSVISTYNLSDKKKIDFAVGGQAVIEGVMMRSPNYTVVSVRNNSGEILENQEFYQQLARKYKFFGLPLVRGIINLFEMLFIGTKALDFSSKAFLGEEIKPEKKPTLVQNLGLLISIVFALGLSIFLFKFVPLWLTDFFSHFSPTINQSYLLFNLIDGLLKISIFIGYLSLLSLLPDIKRVFAYHGAEHKSIMTYEKGLELTSENAAKQTRFHPRCGTSFILIVFFISVFVFTLIPKHPDFISNFLIRLSFLPIVAALSYEFLKYSAAKTETLLFKILTSPGLWLQRLTTREPDQQMLEVALNSLKLSLKLEDEFKSKVI